MLNYFILGHTANALLLFGGSFFALMAIFALAYSDTFDKAQRVPNIETTSPMHPSDHGIPDDVVYDKVSQDLEALSTDIPPEGSSLKHPQWVPRFDR